VASNRAQQLADMSDRDLAQELDDVQKELLNVRFQYATHQNTNYSRISILKRDVARIRTIIHERALEEAGA